MRAALLLLLSLSWHVMPLTPLSVTGPAQVLAQANPELKPVLEQLIRRMAEAQPTDRPLRLAVMPLVPGAGLTDLGLGEYLSNSLVTHLHALKKQFRLFERQRLELVIKEQAFSLSGLVNATEARRLGEILPIDAILTGSYVALSDGIEIQIRLLSAVTGEILFSAEDRATLSAEQRALFRQGAGALEPPSQPSADPCRGIQERFQSLLRDLSQPAKISNVVKEAIQIPFDNTPCGQVHFRIMAGLRQAKLAPPDYQSFLQQTLKSIPYTGDDQRMREILYFFSQDQQIDDAEWEAALAALEKTPPGLQHLALARLFGDERSQTARPIEEQRIHTYFQAVQAYRMGRPTPMTPAQGLSQLLIGLRRRPDLRYFVLQAFRSALGSESRDILEALDAIYSLLKSLSVPEQQRQLLTWAAEITARADGIEKVGDRLFEVAYLLEQDSQRSKWLPLFITLNRPALIRYTRESRFPYQQEERKAFCIRQQIAIPGLIPSLDEALKTILQDSDWQRRQQAMQFLVMTRPTAAQSETALIRLLQQKQVDHAHELRNLQAQALWLLGQQRCSRPEVLHFMLQALSEPHYTLAEQSQEALVNIGKPAVPALRKYLMALDLNQTGLQYKLIRILARMGKQAAEARPDLQKLLPVVRHRDVRYAIEAALQAFSTQ